VIEVMEVMDFFLGGFFFGSTGGNKVTRWRTFPENSFRGYGRCSSQNADPAAGVTVVHVVY
jgi:hypothetical protein